jgi:hypothetical protein
MGQGAPQWHAYPIMPWENDSANDGSCRLPAPASRCRSFLCEIPAEMLDRLDRAEGKGLRFGGEVGYDPEAAFSRPFKKATGLVPGAWREVRRTARIASNRAPAHLPPYPANHAADPTPSGGEHNLGHTDDSPRGLLRAPAGRLGDTLESCRSRSPRRGGPRWADPLTGV